MNNFIATPADERTDMALTKVYLQKADMGDKYKCFKPNCDFETTDPDEFVRHFQKHINDFLTGSWT